MELFPFLLGFLLAVSPVVLVSLLFFPAPYGRHGHGRWSRVVGTRTGWILMELPAVFAIATVYFLHTEKIAPAHIIFLVIWEVHYLYRAFWFPMKLSRSRKSFPVAILIFAILFNLLNGYLNGIYLFGIRPISGMNYFFGWNFIAGMIIYFLGFAIHFHADGVISGLKQKHKGEYAIPRGGMFRYVSSPNYLGEFIQWSGWALLTWSSAGLAFAVFTFCNLFPRAISNHNWYKQTFPEYPTERKRFFPFIY